LTKVIKKIQSQFSEGEWNYLRKVHKKTSSSIKSSSFSGFSIEEEKFSSDNSSIASHNSKEMASTSSSKRHRARRKPRTKAPEAIAEERAEDSDIERIKNHIELKDLSEQDFLEMIEAKSSNTRYFWWLHDKQLAEKMHIDKKMECHPLEDIELFE